MRRDDTAHEFVTSPMGLTKCQRCGQLRTVPLWPTDCSKKKKKSTKSNPPEPQEILDKIGADFRFHLDDAILISIKKLNEHYIPRQKVEEALPKHKCKEEVCQADHSITQAIDDLRTKLGLDK